MKFAKYEGRLLCRQRITWVIPILLALVMLVPYWRQVQQSAYPNAKVALTRGITIADAGTDASLKQTVNEHGDQATAAKHQLKLSRKVRATARKGDVTAFTQAAGEYMAYGSKHVLIARQDASLYVYLAKHHINLVLLGNKLKPAINSLLLLTMEPNVTLLILLVVAVMISAWMTEGGRKRDEAFALIPRNQVQLGLTKVGLTVFGVIAAVVLAMGVVVGMMTMHGGFGALNYPVLFKNTAGATVIVGIGQILGHYLILLVAWILFLTGIGYFVRTLSPRLIVNLIVLVAIILLGQSTLMTGSLTSFALFWPSAYVDIGQIVTQGRLTTEMSETSALLPAMSASWLLVAYAVLFFGLALGIIAHRKHV